MSIETNNILNQRLIKIIKNVLQGTPFSIINGLDQKLVRNAKKIREINEIFDYKIVMYLEEFLKKDLNGEELIDLMLEAYDLNMIPRVKEIFDTVLLDNLELTIDALYELVALNENENLSWAIYMNLNVVDQQEDKKKKQKPIDLKHKNFH